MKAFTAAEGWQVLLFCTVSVPAQVPVPMTQEEQVHVPKVITQTRIRHQPVEQVVEATGLQPERGSPNPSSRSTRDPNLKHQAFQTLSF